MKVPMSDDQKITTVKAYTSRIRPTEDSLTHALNARRLEIELYWRRTAYFWTLIAASLAAFFLLISADRHQEELIFIVACIGTTISLAWYLANRGSKYWQKKLGNATSTSLSKRVTIKRVTMMKGLTVRLSTTTISKDLYSFLELSNGYPIPCPV